jgi:hypothetical protein
MRRYFRPMKKLAFFLVCMAIAGLLAAQTAEELDRILNTQVITSSQAAYFVLAAADILPNDTNALAFAKDNRWLSAGKEAESPIRLGEVAYLIMRSFNLKGGILYTLFPGPRYACRELVALQFIQGKTDPGARISGTEFLQLLGRVLTYTETAEVGI